MYIGFACHMVDLTSGCTLQRKVHFPQFVKWLIIKVHKRIDRGKKRGSASISSPKRPVQVSFVKTEHKLNNGHNKLPVAGVQ